MQAMTRLAESQYISLIERIKAHHAWDLQQGWKTAESIYPPATEEQLRASEQALGFPLPPLLRTLYAQVANGGFGPDHGIKGALGGFGGDLGTIVEMYLEGMEEVRRGRAQVVDLATYEQLAYDIDVRTIGYSVVLNKVIELPERALPESLLGFYSHGCGIFSHIDLGTGRILLEEHPYLYYEAHSLEEWLERWLDEAAQRR
jgi:SMI1 / KNR4 family (SUKH-1)